MRVALFTPVRDAGSGREEIAAAFRTVGADPGGPAYGPAYVPEQR